MQTMLDEFIKKNIKRDGFTEYLTNSYSPVLKDYYLQYDLTTYSDIIKQEKQQALLHRFMEIECNKLFAYCNEKNIKIVGLKGLFLEKQFWKSPRYYNDIDVIIDTNKIEQLYDYFSKQGTYKLVEKRNYNPFVTRSNNLSKMLRIDLNKTHHIVIWNESKEISSNGLEHIEIEIHGCFDTFNIVDINNTIMFDDSIKIQNYNVLSNESQILYLIFHTIQHLPYIRHNLTGLYVEINRFVDVALVVLNSEIDWKKFFKLCIIHNMSPLCSFYFKMFNIVFPNIVPSYIINRIDKEAEGMDFKWKKIYRRLMKMDAIDLIIGNFKDFPELERPYSWIKKHILKGRYENKYILKFAMEIWKLKLLNLLKTL